jgi:hypothetical protein
LKGFRVTFISYPFWAKEKKLVKENRTAAIYFIRQVWLVKISKKECKFG